MPTLLTLIERDNEYKSPMALLEQLTDLTLGCAIPGSCRDTWLTAGMIEDIDRSIRRRFLKWIAVSLALGLVLGGTLVFLLTAFQSQRQAYDNGYRAGIQATSSIRYTLPKS